MGKVDDAKPPGRPTVNAKVAEAGNNQKTKLDKYAISTRSGVTIGNKEDTVNIEKSFEMIMTELKGIKGKMEENKEEIKREFTKEIDTLKENIAERDKKWEEEKNTLWERIDLLEYKIQKIEEDGLRPMTGSQDENEMWAKEKEMILQQQVRIQDELKKMEQMKIKQLRYERKNNVVIKGLNEVDGDLQKAAEKIMEERFGVKIESKNTRVQRKNKKVVMVKMKQKYQLEIRAATAAAELSELNLLRQQNKN